MKRKIETSKPLYRETTFDKSAINNVDRTVRLSVSSDEPYLRRDFFGAEYYEILDHSSSGVDESRLKAGTPLLFGHDTNLHLGRNVSFENSGHKISVTAKFSRSSFAEEKWQDVLDGILVDSSIGYQITDVTELDRSIDGVPCYSMKWLPLEASLVCVPADVTVGINRNQRTHMETNTTQEQKEEHKRTKTQERERIQEIQAIAKRANNVPAAEVERAINEEISVNAFRKLVFDKYYGTAKPIHTPMPGFTGNRMLDGNAPSIAEQIVGHPEMRKTLEGGRKIVSFTLPGVRSFREALSRSTNVTGDIGTTIQQLPGVQGVAYEVLTVADLLDSGTMDSGQINYPREGSFTSEATTVTETAAKPSQDFDLVPDLAFAKKIAAFCKISTELLQDSPAAAAYINNRLGFAVLKAEDLQILRGDGLGSNMRGIHSTPGLGVQMKGADIAPDAIRRAINLVETTTDFYCTGIVLHPTDFMNIELLKDLQGRYLVQPVLIRGELGQMLLAPSLWGKPISISKSETQGTALVGAFRTAAQLFRRTGLLIESTNSNEDDFRRNLIAIRAELRAALAVYNGSAFCEVTGL
jgi:HK97 family phage major capsid protein